MGLFHPVDVELSYRPMGILGLRSIEADDIVVAVSRSRMPLILRRRRESHRFQPIRPAYVHGIMNGECIEKLQEMGSPIELSTFEID